MTGPCRCLIGEMPDEAELAGIIRERIEAIPEEERVPEEEYARRFMPDGYNNIITER